MMWQDLRHGARTLARNPGFAFVAMLSIAVGVGANAATFSLADTLLLRPITAPRASEIVNITSVIPRSGFASPNSSAVSYPDYADIQDRARSFSSLAAYRLVVVGVAETADALPQRKFGLAVSGSLFDTLGVQPLLGRPIGREDDRVAGRDRVVVLDHGMWRRQFASDAGVIGRRVRIGGVDMTVIGVMPPTFTGPDQFVQPEFYVPTATLPLLQHGPASEELTSRDLQNFVVKGRLAPGVPMARASQEIQLIGEDLERAYPETNRNRGLTVRTEFGARVSARPPLAALAAMMMTLALVVLLVACANVAGLLASRAPVRAREMALRLAVGAGRLRLARQLMAESLLIALGGGLAGLALGSGLIAIFQQVRLPTDVPLKLAFELDRRVVLVGLGVSALSAVVSSLAPAWRAASTDLVTTLKGARTGDAHRLRLWGRNTLACGQVALSLVLLTVAVFLYRAFQAEIGRGPGFRTDHIFMMTFDPGLAGYDGPRSDAFYQRLKDSAASIGGVRSVTLTSAAHMDQINTENTAIVPEGVQLPPGTENVRVRSARVDEAYFDTAGIRILAGRGFRTADTRDAPPVAVVNSTLAARYWPGQNAIGKRFRVGAANATWVEIVGLAASVKYATLSEAATEFVYYSRAQNPASHGTLIGTLLVRTDVDAASVAAPLRDAVRAIDPSMPLFGVRTMEDFYGNAVALSHVPVQAVGAMGAMALVIAMAGLYGLVAYSVSLRTREIGIRMAVGAHPRTVLRMVLRQGLLLAAGGSLLGLAGSIATAGLLRAVFPFPGLGGVDLFTYLVVVPVLLAVTLLAAYLPARRAARIDPLVALRTD